MLTSLSQLKQSNSVHSIRFIAVPARLNVKIIVKDVSQWNHEKKNMCDYAFHSLAAAFFAFVRTSFCLACPCSFSFRPSCLSNYPKIYAFSDQLICSPSNDFSPSCVALVARDLCASRNGKAPRHAAKVGGGSEAFMCRHRHFSVYGNTSAANERDWQVYTPLSECRSLYESDFIKSRVSEMQQIVRLQQRPWREFRRRWTRIDGMPGELPVHRLSVKRHSALKLNFIFARRAVGVSHTNQSLNFSRVYEDARTVLKHDDELLIIYLFAPRTQIIDSDRSLHSIIIHKPNMNMFSLPRSLSKDDCQKLWMINSRCDVWMSSRTSAANDWVNGTFGSDRRLI